MIAWVFVWRFYIIPPQGRPHKERRLDAILVADMVGYSRLTGADEEATWPKPKRMRKVRPKPTEGGFTNGQDSSAKDEQGQSDG